MKKIIKVASVCALITLLSGCIIGPRHGGGWHHGGGYHGGHHGGYHGGHHHR
ncbi:hypothetical protein O3W44_17825 [Pantoea sp. LMR881]|uniref:hypothetical protein n=1 Tax=Pantoea sp. LMR881 TaxID=3014336 RepID=UPI0022AEB718|nr:hypothetical protein [Pantoea sp. LMR881]MCZ4060562.1 hypothetical protein [Pantoea sp. LMR881]